MSQLFGYLGPSTTLDRLLLSTPNSVSAQARGTGALRPGEICAAGFGFGWYPTDGSPCGYRSALPIWLDENLPDLARGLESDIWLGAAFDARDTGGRDERPAPLHDDELLFLFEGLVPDFGYRARPRLREYLASEIEAEIVGGGAGEHLFALLRHLLAGDEELSVEEAIAQLYELCRDWLGRESADLSFLLSDGQRLYTARLGHHMEPAACYYTTDDEAFPEAQVVASKPLTESDFWHPLPEDCVLILDPEQPPELLDLEATPG
jgi:glutamine amidotransferase